MILVTNNWIPRIAWHPIKCYKFNNQEDSKLFPIFADRCGNNLYSIQNGYTWCCLDESVAKKHGIKVIYTIPKYSLYFISNNNQFICYKLWKI